MNFTDPWMIWIAIGVICMIIEIFTPGFLFLSFGLGAIITGLITLTHIPLWAQLVVFIVISIILFLNLRKLSVKLTKETIPTNVDALMGKKGFVTEQIPEAGKGYVKIGGETWSAISQDETMIEVNQKIVVKNIDGNKLIVKIFEEEA
ncbi:MAG: NfeD family protein [Candidatus Stygibacter australis]|nr:NfeD family protein [Candidatus Stygibacter australis]MDP8321258.1 NfeD family protein [Candidatus Stygibacter australis]